MNQLESRLPDEVPFHKLHAPYFEHFCEILGDLKSRPDDLLELESESYGQFACTQCGDCCQLPWRIEISREYYDAWFEVFDQHPSGRFRIPFEVFEKPTQKVYAGIRRQEGSYRCIFLEQDNACFIHREFGTSALSRVCLEYPRLHKDMGNHFATRQLMHSCQPVPELLDRFPGILYRIMPFNRPVPLLQPITEYPGRYETYLLIGMLLDLLEAPQPGTILARWRLFLPTLEWMEGIGMHRISEDQFRRMYHDLLNRAAFAGLDLPDPQQQRKALQWARFFLASHPSCSAWIREHLEKDDWPVLSLEERQLLDRYLGHYLRSRLLSLPYWDQFIGKLSLWQQSLLLGIQLLTLQCLALFYREQASSELQPTHLQRAINVAGFRFEQRNELSQEFQFKDLQPEQCYDGLVILQSVDFAGSQVWTPPFPAVIS